MKAWRIGIRDGGPHEEREYGEIVLAETRGKAVAKSYAYSDGIDWQDISASRAPAFDGVDVDNTKEMMERGAYTYCYQCDKPIRIPEDEGDPEVVFTKDGARAYCSISCFQALDEEVQ